MIDNAAWRSIRTVSQVVIAKEADLTVEGAEHLPESGPVLLVARHYHHLIDGCAVIATVPRPVKVLVGLDWIERPLALGAMQRACRMAGWPVVFRNTNDIDRARWLPSLRRALQQSGNILANGGALLVFPEGYPTIDPHGSPKTRDDEVLPFNSGFARIAIESWRAGLPTAIVPIGFRYEAGVKWRVRLRFGAAISPATHTRASQLTAEMQHRVIELSQPGARLT